MHPSDSLSEFEARLRAAALTGAGLNAPEAARQMLAFYQEVRAENCMEEEDGDMLLYQWGTPEWEEETGFQFNLTRQFIEPGTEDEDGISQLSLTLHYPSSDALADLGADNHWCESPEKLGEFESFIHESPAYGAVSALQPLKVTLMWDLV